MGTHILLIMYKPLHIEWSSKNLLSAIDKNSPLLNKTYATQYHVFMKAYLQDESDSTNLYNELFLNQTISPELKQFLDPWYAEELNHADGYYQIFDILFDENETETRTIIESKPSDFTFMQSFFDDEFKFCVLMAFDEYTTMLDYKKHSFYQRFGSPIFVEWIKRVTKDEARHCMNSIQLIHCKHAHRVAETQQVLNHILEIGETHGKYKATFVFDYAGKNFLLNRDELQKSAHDVLHLIQRS